ncbi:recombinase family protein [candidate division KSB1 bacterium]
MQRKAILYTRVSTDEQKEQGFSLQEQEARLKRYCAHENIDIAEHYQEDYSAKNFNRPEFQKMLLAIKEKRLKANLFLCIRIDRFSRNMLESILMIQEFQKYGLEFRVIEGGNFDLDTPENLIPHMINLLLPQVENERRGLNTKRGMRQARREGRWTGTVPKGYSWHRENGTSLIVPNEDAKFIKEAFETFSKGIYSVEEVRKIMWKKGYKCSRNNFHKLLKNPVYIGKIKIEAWKDEDEELVNGLHEPIIEEELFYNVQEIITRRKRTPKKKSKLNDNLPLRGYLICGNCGGNLTGSASKSRTGARYYYYHCHNRCNERFRADKANMQFVNYLGSFEISDEVLKLYYHIMKDLFNKDDQHREKEKAEYTSHIREFESMIENAEDKFIKNEIDMQTYENVKKRYSKRINDMTMKIQEIDLQKSNFMRYVEYDFPLLGNLEAYYNQADVSVKQKIIGSIFPDKLLFEGEKCRTTKINSVLAILTNNINNLGEIKKGQAMKNKNLSHRASPRGVEPLLQGRKP